jgi:hypothetical protein
MLFASIVNADILDVYAQKSPQDDAAKISEYQDRCIAIKTLIVNKEFALDCYTNYNHYGATSNSVRSTGALKIANYNLLHPGTSKALFKDYSLIAKIMNRFDIVSGLELLGTVGRDEKNNRAVLELIQSSEEMVTKLRQQKEKLKDQIKIQELDVKIVKLLNDTRTAYDLYRAPGYLRVLMELKKLDASWALILSPRGDSALPGSVEELSGYFYRSNAVAPSVNPHCKEMADSGGGTPYACLITLTEDFMGKNLAKHFARRPFMASFKTRGKSFTLVTSHMVFTYSGDDDAEKDLMQKTFGVDTYKVLGGGINSTNFARFAEVKNTLAFMDLYRKKYKDNRIMFLADTNLVSNNIFWPEVLKAFPGGKLLITEPTTLSPARYISSGKETNGVANDYDHFILDKTAFSECDDGEVYNYYKENIYKEIERRYVVRKEVVGLTKKIFNFNIETYETEHILDLDSEDSTIVEDGDIPPVDDPVTIKLEYPLTPAGQSKMDKFAGGFEKYLSGLYTVKRNEVVEDDFQVQERLEGLRRRVFLRQLTNPYYYRFMQEILSDHFPVFITCKY